MLYALADRHIETPGATADAARRHVENVLLEAGWENVEADLDRFYWTFWTIQNADDAAIGSGAENLDHVKRAGRPLHAAILTTIGRR